MSTEIVARRESSEALESIRDLEDRFALAVRQRELLEVYIKARLKPGKHFYKVKEGQKDSLKKEGAELICLPHGYKPAYFIEGGPLEPPEDDTPYQLTLRCRLLKEERFAGEGMGSASSHITLKTGERVVRMRDIGLRHNATLKVAEKSAYIAATLNATAASEFFTQDLEDEGAASEATSDHLAAPADAYFCTQHRTKWFKKGKMKAYAHPIKDSDGRVISWCNMPDKAGAALARTKEILDSAISDAQEGPQLPEDSEPPGKGQAVSEGFSGTTIVELLNHGLSLGFKNKADILAALNVKDTALIADLQEAARLLEEKAKP